MDPDSRGRSQHGTEEGQGRATLHPDRDLPTPTHTHSAHPHTHPIQETVPIRHRRSSVPMTFDPESLAPVRAQSFEVTGFQGQGHGFPGQGQQYVGQGHQYMGQDGVIMDQYQGQSNMEMSRLYQDLPYDVFTDAPSQDMNPAQTHFTPAHTHFIPSQTHYNSSQTHFTPSQSHFPGSQTHFLGSETNIPPQSHQPYMPATQTYMAGSQGYVPLSPNYVPMTQSYVPITQSYVPMTQQSYVPMTQQSYVPMTQQSYVPMMQQSYVPMTQQSYVPMTQQSYVPTTQQSYVPMTQQSYMPRTQSQSYGTMTQSFVSGSQVPSLAPNTFPYPSLVVPPAGSSVTSLPGPQFQPGGSTFYPAAGGAPQSMGMGLAAPAGHSTQGHGQITPSHQISPVHFPSHSNPSQPAKVARFPGAPAGSMPQRRAQPHSLPFRGSGSNPDTTTTTTTITTTANATTTTTTTTTITTGVQKDGAVRFNHMGTRSVVGGHTSTQHTATGQGVLGSNPAPVASSSPSEALLVQRMSKTTISDTDAGETTVKTHQEESILDALLTTEEGKEGEKVDAGTMRDVVQRFMRETYRDLWRVTYRLPHKQPVNQHHPDRALVRNMEGELRVCYALEQLSIHDEDHVFVLCDYQYESFLHHLGRVKVWPSHQRLVQGKLSTLRREQQFGDFDVLVFHPRCGVMVLGLCCVNSNSDVQYILKRVQKSRSQVERSVSVVEHYTATLNLKVPVTPVLSTPNLKRPFLAKVMARDKTTDWALQNQAVLFADHLPAQFRSQWSNSASFAGLAQWWAQLKDTQVTSKVKVKVTDEEGQGQGQPWSSDDLALLLGCFLCPSLSKVRFDQPAPYPPSEREQVVEEQDEDDDHVDDTAHDRDTASPDPEGVSDLYLHIGNTPRPFNEVMKRYVDLYFPNVFSKTYRVPPIHYNIQNITFNKDKHYVLHHPMSKDSRGDEGENRVVSAVEILGLRYKAVNPVFILCDFQYNHYLSKLKENMFVKGEDRRPRRAYGQTLRAQHDCLLIHRRYGIIIISVKAVGDNFKDWADNSDDWKVAVKRTLGKVLKQLPREESMVKMVLHDLTLTFHLPCTKVVALPNLRRRDVDAVVNDDLNLKQEIAAMFPMHGTGAFLTRDELCGAGESVWSAYEDDEEFFPNLCRWWDRAVGVADEEEKYVLSKQLYRQIIGRFCGLLSTVEVWTAQAPRVEVRNLEEAVQETAQRFSRILLTQQQLEILYNRSPFVFLSGPPGTGKTLTLVLKSKHWIDSLERDRDRQDRDTKERDKEDRDREDRDRDIDREEQEKREELTEKEREGQSERDGEREGEKRVEREEREKGGSWEKHKSGTAERQDGQREDKDSVGEREEKRQTEKVEGGKEQERKGQPESTERQETEEETKRERLEEKDRQKQTWKKTEQTDKDSGEKRDRGREGGAEEREEEKDLREAQTQREERQEKEEDREAGTERRTEKKEGEQKEEREGAKKERKGQREKREDGTQGEEREGGAEKKKKKRKRRGGDGGESGMEKTQLVILNMRYGSAGLPLGHLLLKQVQEIMDQNEHPPSHPHPHHPNLHPPHQHHDKDGKDHTSQKPPKHHHHPHTTTTTITTATTTTTTSFSSSPLLLPRPASSSSTAGSSPPGLPVVVKKIDVDIRKFQPKQPGKLAEIQQGAYIIVDEVTHTSHAVIQWVMDTRQPRALWCAGQFSDYCPPGFIPLTLRHILRCPPMVQQVLHSISQELGSAGQEMDSQDYVFSSAPYGLATDGSRPKFIFHSSHNCSSPFPMGCAACGGEVADFLLNDLRLQTSTVEMARRRRLGPLPSTPAATLTFQDVVLVCRQVIASTFVAALKKRGLPIAMVTDTANPQVALPPPDSLVFTSPFAMTGLERKVVIYVAFEMLDSLKKEEEEGGGGGGKMNANVGGGGVKVGATSSSGGDDLKVKQALGKLTAEDRVSLWYTASRCMSQLIVVVP